MTYEARDLLLWATMTAAVIVLTGAPCPEAKAQTAIPAAPSGSPIEYHANQQTLTVHLNGLPLNQVMEELSKQTHIRFRPPDPAHTFDSRPVTASFERMPIERAIKQLLGPSNTAMLYGTTQSTEGIKPRLLEVRVLDLGIIPVVATSAINSGPFVSPGSRLSPEELQARREEIQKRREERQARSNRGGGGRHAPITTSPDSSQTDGQNSGNQPSGQSSGNTGNGSKPSSGGQQPSANGSTPNGNNGGGGGGK